MEYFYIMSSVASLISFIGSLIVLYRDSKSHILARYLSIGFSLLTVGFWAWFYFAPRNPAKAAIAKRSILVETYADKGQYIDIVEGHIEFSTYEPLSVFLPPFKSKPTITFGRDGGVAPYDPILIKVTEDKFIAKIDNSKQLGEWHYRARGELLRKLQ